MAGGWLRLGRRASLVTCNLLLQRRDMITRHQFALPSLVTCNECRGAAGSSVHFVHATAGCISPERGKGAIRPSSATHMLQFAPSTIGGPGGQQAHGPPVNVELTRRRPARREGGTTSREAHQQKLELTELAKPVEMPRLVLLRTTRINRCAGESRPCRREVQSHPITLLFIP